MKALGVGEVREVLCLGAHCDDIEIGCGGTLRWLRRTCPQALIRWHVFGSNETREGETRAAAMRLVGDGPHSIVVDRFRDGYFPFEGAAIKDRFEAFKSEYSPDLVLTHRLDDAHQDHRLVAELTGNTFRDHLVLAYEIPKYDGDLTTPNVYVPLEAADVEAKVDTLMDVYASQHSRTWFTADTFRSLLRLRGVECNAPSGFAEGFHCAKAVLA